MMRVLILNTGSSSVKWTLLAADRTSLAGGNEPWVSEDRTARSNQLRDLLKRVPAFDAVGHRVVHGGGRFCESVTIDERVREELAELIAIDPEHMHISLAGIDAVSSAFSAVPQIAVFDTAFHATMPEAAAGYGLPFEWTERWGLRRFGFHGLSVSYALERVSHLLHSPPSRLIVCHLGGGCSVTAVKDGRSLDTTMGFSPLEGLMMATRSGSIDPGLLFYLQQHCKVGVDELRDTLTTRSGLRGVSGVSGDLREVLKAAEKGSARANLAYERFVLSIRRALGEMMGVLTGVDTVVFTGGIGENSPRTRRDATSALRFSGFELDEDANAGTSEDREISTSGSQVRVFVIRAREDLAILTEVLQLLQAAVPAVPNARSSLARWENEGGAARPAHRVRDLTKKLIVFDLDGTLAESKSALDSEMAALLDALLRVVKVAVISGGGWPQFEKQLLSRLTGDERLKNLSLLPTCGTQFFEFGSEWTRRYAEDFTDEERKKIIRSLKSAIHSSGFRIETTWGEQIEDRGSQITFSALGQAAPLPEKEKWDPDFAKRKKMQATLEGLIPGFSVRLGGTTSVDVTKPGIDKAYGVRKLRDALGIGLDEMLFIGDALFPGGNDYPAKEAGVESIQVRDPDESKRVIQTILACLGSLPAKAPNGSRSGAQTNQLFRATT